MYLRENNTKLITFGDKLIEIKNIRHAELRDASVKIHTFLKENLLLFYNVPLVDPNSGKLFSQIPFLYSFIIIIIINFFLYLMIFFF